MALTKASDRDRCSTGQGMPGCGNETWEIPLGDRRGASLLILTGCRLTEIMMLKWSYVDLPTATLNLPDSKTGAKVVHIGKPAMDVVRRIPPLPGNPWVIAGKNPGAGLSDLQPFWQRLLRTHPVMAALL